MADTDGGLVDGELDAARGVESASSDDGDSDDGDSDTVRPSTHGLDRAPALGPYCPITGDRLWPWYTQVLVVAYHVLCLVAIFVGANHLHTALYGADSPGRSRAVLLWVGLATAVHVAGWFFARLGFATRTLLAVGAALAVVSAWNEPQPVVFADPELDWTVALDGVRRTWDTFLDEAGLPPALVLFAIFYALCSAFVTASTLRSVVRSWNLPRRSWFVRYHPVWRRTYEPRESAYPLAGVLFVRRDELLTDKLIFLVSKERDAAFRCAPPPLAAQPPAIPLGALAAPFTFWRDGEHWWSSTIPADDGDAPFSLRLLHEPRRLPEASRDDAALIVPTDPRELPVRDIIAADEACVGKHYDGGGEREELFGLLFDSRPELGDGDLPRFVVFLRQYGRVRAERSHPDLLGAPHVEGDQILVPWRGPGSEPLTLELDGARDSVHYIETADQNGYHLMFLAFAPSARSSR